MAGNEPALIYYASVRDSKLGDPADEPSMQEANHKSGGKHGNRNVNQISASISALEIVFQRNKNDGEDKPQDRLPINDPMSLADYEDLFVRLKDGADITHGAISRRQRGKRRSMPWSMVVCHSCLEIMGGEKLSAHQMKESKVCTVFSPVPIIFDAYQLRSAGNSDCAKQF